jgi:hypothetical protein
MRRRDFVLAGGAAVVSLAAPARGAERPTIGFLRANTRSSDDPLIAAFVQRLHELGWTKDRNIAIELRWSEEATIDCRR